MHSWYSLVVHKFSVLNADTPCCHESMPGFNTSVDALNVKCRCLYSRVNAGTHMLLEPGCDAVNDYTLYNAN